MKKGILKTGYHDLQDCLLEILKVPQRLNRCDEVLKMELLEHIENATSSVIGSINEVMIFNPNYPYPKEYINNHFGYWANNVSQVFTYNQLQYLKELIQNSIEIVNKPPEVDIYPFRKIEYLNGFLEYKKQVTDAYGDYGYVFQRLLKEKYIYKMLHNEFTEWLHDNKHINDKDYKCFKVKNGFYTFKNSYSVKKEQIFNVSFGL